MLSTGLILGSASPRRASLLRQIGAAFETRSADADESLENLSDPREYVMELAARKARAVSDIIRGDADIRKKYNRVIIIGADTVVVTINGDILGKPKDSADAERMLRLLSGNWHEVFTGVSLMDMRLPAAGAAPTDLRISSAVTHTGGDGGVFGGCGGADRGFYTHAASADYEKTRVKVCELDEEAIGRYVGSGEPEGKAGAYAIQGVGSLFIDRVEGCYYNIVGLPLRLLRTMLGALGYDLLKTNCLGHNNGDFF